MLDHDPTKSALMDTGVTHPTAGIGSYNVFFFLVEDLLSPYQRVQQLLAAS